MNEEAIRNPGILPMPDWEHTNSKPKTISAVYQKPVIKSVLKSLDIALFTSQTQQAISPSAMKELDATRVSHIAEVAIRGSEDGHDPDSGYLFKPAKICEHLHSLHNEQV